MPLDWSAYDAFAWGDSQQRPMAVTERASLTSTVAHILSLSSESDATCWGAASPPGRYAATVVRVNADLVRPQWRVGAGEIPFLAVKVFKTTPDARREAARLLPFHQNQLAHLPGIPHSRVQRSLATGQRDGRAWLLLEWLPGIGLDVWRAGYTRRNPAPLDTARGLIRQLLGEIVLPLWNVGLIWWDFRDANCCVEPQTNRLALLDVDSLAAYADEILTTPTVWKQRDRGRVAAERRLRNMTWRLLQTAGRSGKHHSAVFRTAWDERIAPALATIGRVFSLEAALEGLTAFLTEV